MSLDVQTKQFADKDNADLFAEEAAQQREVRVCVVFAIPLSRETFTVRSCCARLLLHGAHFMRCGGGA